MLKFLLFKIILNKVFFVFIYKRLSIVSCVLNIAMYICNYFNFPKIQIMQSNQLDYLPILMQAGLAIGFVVLTIIGSSFLGPKRHSASKDKNFECGIESIGNARIPFSVKYFLVAILFVLFDVEVIFLYPWAVNFKELGVEGMIKMVIFMMLLLVGFFYIIKKKALEWE
jgi:NADH-quinone oxidoreductase subunit A